MPQAPLLRCFNHFFSRSRGPFLPARICHTGSYSRHNLCLWAQKWQKKTRSARAAVWALGADAGRGVYNGRMTPVYLLARSEKLSRASGLQHTSKHGILRKNEKNRNNESKYTRINTHSLARAFFTGGASGPSATPGDQRSLSETALVQRSGAVEARSFNPRRTSSNSSRRRPRGTPS